MISANASGFGQSMKKKKIWHHRLSSSAGLVGKPSPQMFSPTKHCNFSIRTRWGRPLKARNSSTGVVCCPKHGWCQCKTLRPGERNLNQDRKHQIAFHWEQLQMLTTRSLFFKGEWVGGGWNVVLGNWRSGQQEVTNKEKPFDNIIALNLRYKWRVLCPFLVIVLAGIWAFCFVWADNRREWKNKLYIFIHPKWGNGVLQQQQEVIIYLTLRSSGNLWLCFCCFLVKA